MEKMVIYSKDSAVVALLVGMFFGKLFVPKLIGYQASSETFTFVLCLFLVLFWNPVYFFFLASVTK